MHSRGVAILARNTLDFTLKSVQSDEEGRFLCLEAIIQDQLFLLINIYAPNTSTFKKIESPLCYLCENDIVTIEHFLFLCPRVQVFWNEVCSTFGEKLKWSRSLHIKDIFFGSQDLKIHNTLTNYIILESKYFLYRCKLNKTPLSILHLTEKIKNTYYIERSIARENNKIGFHYEKWGPLLPLISP